MLLIVLSGTNIVLVQVQQIVTEYDSVWGKNTLEMYDAAMDDDARN